MGSSRDAPVLMQLMRHESIETTMRYYVGRNVNATADVVWTAYDRAKKDNPTTGIETRDTLRDSGQSLPGEASEKDDVS